MIALKSPNMGTVYVDVLRRSARINAVYNLSYKTVKETFSEQADQAVIKEVTQMITKEYSSSPATVVYPTTRWCSEATCS